MSRYLPLTGEIKWHLSIRIILPGLLQGSSISKSTIIQNQDRLSPALQREAVEMVNLKIHGWGKKERTMIRFINSGDIFCFKLNNGKYGFGRIISKVSIGHTAEIFNFVSSSPDISADMLEVTALVFPPVVLDSYSLFDKRISGDWQIIGHQDGYSSVGHAGVFFSYGVGDSCKRVDINGNVQSIASADKNNYPPYTPKNDNHIQAMIHNAQT
ncbi:MULTISPECIES: immunity 26/phosphotriesterase HocA family protein [unclassified Paraburkholderia]|uniref:immunity 26/phosphotriesterase HocA family protein n=1 Tax=unclassified Paraburkholderia TaxID=2615204 RepID=UPI0038B90B8A